MEHTKTIKVAIAPAYDDPERKTRYVEIDARLIAARKHMDKLLPNALSTHQKQWMYVTSSGRHEFGKTFEAVELKALNSGLSEDEFVTCKITALELC